MTITNIIALTPAPTGQYHLASELYVNSDIDMNNKTLINSGNISITGSGGGIMFPDGSFLTSFFTGDNGFERMIYDGGGSGMETSSNYPSNYDTYNFNIDKTKIFLGGYVNVTIGNHRLAYGIVYLNGIAIASQSGNGRNDDQVGSSKWVDLNIQMYLKPGMNTFACGGNSLSDTTTSTSCNIEDIRIYFLSP